MEKSYKVFEKSYDVGAALARAGLPARLFSQMVVGNGPTKGPRRKGRGGCAKVRDQPKDPCRQKESLPTKPRGGGADLNFLLSFDLPLSFDSELWGGGCATSESVFSARSEKVLSP